MEMLFQYYALDWIAMFFSLYGMYLIGNKNKWGFVVVFSGNVLWCVVGLMAVSTAIILGNVISMVINIRGWLKWNSSKT